jgi:hypothetical protein
MPTKNIMEWQHNGSVSAYAPKDAQDGIMIGMSGKFLPTNVIRRGIDSSAIRIRQRIMIETHGILVSRNDDYYAD